MQCLIPHQNLKILVRGLHSLSRIGDELYVEPTNDGISFRTVNSAQSAYSSLFFNLSFFSRYESEFEAETSGTCKISMKACLRVFKTPNCMDRHVESCKIEIGKECVKLIFQIQYVQGYTKTHFLSVNDNETVQLKYNKNEMSNIVSILSRTLHNSIKHFGLRDEEITFTVTNDKVQLKNYFEGSEVENQKVVRTNLCIQRSDFETYNVSKQSSITFALRELRAVCTFSESSNSSIGIYFDVCGKPVIFTIENVLYQADYVISTLPPEMVSGEKPYRRSQLSDVASSVPSTSVTNSRRKRHLASVNEQDEDEPDPVESIIAERLVMTKSVPESAEPNSHIHIIQADVHHDPSPQNVLPSTPIPIASSTTNQSRCSFGPSNDSDANLDELLMKIDMNCEQFQMAGQKSSNDFEISGLNESTYKKIDNIYKFCYDFVASKKCNQYDEIVLCKDD